MSGKLAWGYYPTGKVWLPIVVDSCGRLKVDMSNINLGDLANVDTSGVADGDLLYYDSLSGLWIPYKVTGDSLSQTFGASATRLRNLIVEPIAGEVLRIANGATSPFSAVINGAPSDTSVVYDGEANENHLNGLASGAAQWGRIILHNTTRGNSRKIVSVNLVTNTITTEASTDDWANNDVITCQSQTNANVGYFDVDVSAEVPATTEAIFLFVMLYDNEGNYDGMRIANFHTYEAYDAGKRQWLHVEQANGRSELVFLIKLIDQKFTMELDTGCVDVGLITSVKASVEYADT